MTLTWYIVQVSQAGRRAALALREHRFMVYCPMERVWRSIPKGGREAIERPLFAGYLFVGVAPWNDFDHLYDIDGIVRIVETRLSKERLASMVYDMTLRQCAGEFDQTEGRRYLPPKPLVGPLNRTVGPGMTALQRLLKTDDEGRITLLLSGALADDADDEATAA